MTIIDALAIVGEAGVSHRAARTAGVVVSEQLDELVHADDRGELQALG